MATVSARRRHSRGAAALEFALVTPLLLAVFGGIMGFGLMVYAQYQLGQLASQTARTCVSMQQSLAGDPRSSLIACASSTFNTLYANNAPNLCDSALSVQPTTQTIGTPLVSGRQTYLLTVRVTCKKNYLSLINIYSSKASALTSQTLLATSAMPFTP